MLVDWTCRNERHNPSQVEHKNMKGSNKCPCFLLECPHVFLFWSVLPTLWTPPQSQSWDKDFAVTDYFQLMIHSARCKSQLPDSPPTGCFLWHRCLQSLQKLLSQQHHLKKMRKPGNLWFLGLQSPPQKKKTHKSQTCCGRFWGTRIPTGLFELHIALAVYKASWKMYAFGIWALLFD